MIDLIIDMSIQLLISRTEGIVSGVAEHFFHGVVNVDDVELAVGDGD